METWRNGSEEKGKKLMMPQEKKVNLRCIHGLGTLTMKWIEREKSGPSPYRTALRKKLWIKAFQFMGEGEKESNVV